MRHKKNVIYSKLVNNPFKYCFVRCLSTKNAYFNSTNFEKVSYCCFLPIPEPLCSPRWEWAIMSSTPTLPGQPIVPFSMSNTSWSRITLSLICTDLLKDRRRHSHNYAQLPHSFNVSDWLTDGDQQTLDRAELKYTSWSIVIAGTARIFMYFVGVVNVRMRIVWCSTAKIFHSIANTGENRFLFLIQYWTISSFANTGIDIYIQFRTYSNIRLTIRLRRKEKIRNWFNKCSNSNMFAQVRRTQIVCRVYNNKSQFTAILLEIQR